MNMLEITKSKLLGFSHFIWKLNYRCKKENVFNAKTNTDVFPQVSKNFARGFVRSGMLQNQGEKVNGKS